MNGKDRNFLTLKQNAYCLDIACLPNLAISQLGKKYYNIMSL